MGFLKRIERASKHALMRIMVQVVHTEKLSPQDILKSCPKRILVIRQHNQMGDMVLAIPAFRAIKESLPGSEVGVVTSMINRDVLLNNPYIDHLFVYRKKNLFGLPWFIKAIRRERFDLVIVLHTVSFSFTSAMLALLSGAKIRTGSDSHPFGSAVSGAFYHLELPLPDGEALGEMNEAEHNLFPLATLGITTQDLSPILLPSSYNDEWAGEFLSNWFKPGDLKLVVHPGAGKKENIWAPEKFAVVVDRLNTQKPVVLVILCGPRDAEAVAAFSQAVSVPGKILKGRSIGDAAAVMRRADLVLCNDTGTMHVSCAVGARTLAVFGPTNPRRWAPRCRNLVTVRAPEGRLDLLSPDMVFESAAGMLG